MTKIPDLTQLNHIVDRNLFIVYDGNRTRQISAATLKNYIGSLDYNPDAFVNGRIENGHLIMIKQDQQEVDLGKFSISDFNIQDLANVPELEANKVFTVSPDGLSVKFEDWKNTITVDDNKGLIANVSSLIFGKALDVYLNSDTSAIVDFEGLETRDNGALVGYSQILNAGEGISFNFDDSTKELTLSAAGQEKRVTTEILSTTRTITKDDSGTQFISTVSFTDNDLCILPDPATIKEGFFVDVIHEGSFRKVTNIKDSDDQIVVQMQLRDAYRFVKHNSEIIYYEINGETKPLNLVDTQYGDLNYALWGELPDSSYVMNFEGSKYKNFPSDITFEANQNYRVSVDLINYSAYSLHPFGLYIQRITISSGINIEINGYRAIRTGDTFANAQAFGWHVYARKSDLKDFITDLSTHNIQELKNVPALVANGYLKVNSAGSAIEYQSIDSSLFVDKTSNQTIDGLKTFVQLVTSEDGFYIKSSNNKYFKISCDSDTNNLKILAPNAFGQGALIIDKTTQEVSFPFTKITTFPEFGTLVPDKYLQVNSSGDGFIYVDGSSGGNYVTLDTEQTITAKKFISQLAINEVTGLSFELKDAIKWYFTFSTDSFTLTKGDGLTPIQVDSSNNVKLQSGNKSSFSTTTDGIIVYDTEGKSHRVHLGDTGSYLEAFNLKDDKYLALYADGKFAIRCVNDGAVELYNNGNITLSTDIYGIALNNSFNSSNLYFHKNGDNWGIFITDIKGANNKQALEINSSSGAVDLYYNGVKTFYTYPNGVILSQDNSAGSKKAIAFSNATNEPYNSFSIQQHADGAWEKELATFYVDGAVDLYHNGNNVFETYPYGTKHSSDMQNGYLATWYNPTVNNQVGGLEVFQDGVIYTVLRLSPIDTRLYANNEMVFYADATGTWLQRLGQNVFGADAKETTLNKNNVAVFQAYDDGGANRYVCIRDTSGNLRFIGYNASDTYVADSNAVGKIKVTTTYGELIGTWNGSVTPSAIAIKTDVKPLNGLEKLSLLDPISWDWKDPKFFDENMETIGFSVDSFEQVFPECVEVYDPMANQPMDTDDTDPSDKKDSYKDKPISKEDKEKIDYFKGVKGIKKGITSLKMEALIVDAIKELSSKIESLQKEADSLLDDAIKELSNKIESLQKEVDSLKGDKYA